MQCYELRVSGRWKVLFQPNTIRLYISAQTLHHVCILHIPTFPALSDDCPPERPPARPCPTSSFRRATGVIRAGMKEFILSGRYRSVRAGRLRTEDCGLLTADLFLTH